MARKKTIDKLTPDQERQLVAHRDEWRAIGTRTGHDAECAELGRAAIADAYKEIGIDPPALVLWAQSPMQAIAMHWALVRIIDRDQLWDHLRDQLGDQLRDQLGDQLGDQLWGQLRDQLWDQLRGQLGDQLWGQIGDQLRDQLWDQLGGQLGGQLRDQIGGQLRDQIGDQLRDQLGDQLWGQLGDQLRDQLWDQLWDTWNQRWCWGQCEAYWTAWFRFAIAIGVRVTDQQDNRLRIMERLARSAFMAFSWRGVTILVQHPSVARFDAQHRLHCVDGPALAWTDGYAVYAVSGIRLTPERGAAMASGTITAELIQDEPNAEVRRVLVATYNRGDSGRYLRDIGATVIHTDLDALGQPRRLLRVDQPGDEPFTAIEVTNSTPEPDGTRKIYTFRCHPELRPLQVPGIRDELGPAQEMTCHNAIASTYGMTGDEYRLSIET